jgi:hypothetical protein
LGTATFPSFSRLQEIAASALRQVEEPLSAHHVVLEMPADLPL